MNGTGTQRARAESPSSNLLVAVEPAAPSGSALLAEAARLAARMGVALVPVTWPSEADFDVQKLAGVLADAARSSGPVAVLLADTDLGRRLAPVVAHRLGSGAILGCADVLARRRAEPGDAPASASDVVFVKPVYGGWLEDEIRPAPGTMPVVTLDLTGSEAPEGGQDALPVPAILAVADTGATDAPVRRIEIVPPDPRTVDLVHARRIVTAGAGSATPELLAAAGELADLLAGSMGATRPVVDDGLLPKERLIGQTGRIVGPELYLALGVSGSPHHVAGVRDAETILAIDKDARAPIFQFADAGFVADLEAVLPALVEKIREWRDAPAVADEA